MNYKIDVVTTPLPDGRIYQATYSNAYNIREQLTRRVINTQDQRVRDALIKLGWTPPSKL